MSLRVREIDAFCGAYKRAERRDFHVLLNFGNGRVVFVREKDLDRDPIWLLNQVKQRPNLKIFNIRDILSAKMEPAMADHLASNEWKISRIADEFILENALAVSSKPYIFEPPEIFNRLWPIAGR